MRFVLYGQYDPTMYVIARVVSGIEGCYFGYLELDCKPVLIAFSNGGEIARTYDVAGAAGWVEHLALGTGGAEKVHRKTQGQVWGIRSPGEKEPLPVAGCFPRSGGLLEAPTRWLDESPPVQRVTGGVQDPLPGLETPPCR